ncbi:MAG: c-type cytochrome domain-containing protein [Rhodothermales bacterium]
MSKKGWIAGGALLFGVLLVLLAGVERGSAPGFVLFLGRFHPTLVHFPIALLLFGAAIELLAPRWPAAERLRSAVPVLLAVGGLTALAAAVVGYLLSLGGGYAEQSLSRHFWLGITVTVLSFLLALVSAWTVRPGRVYRGMVGAFAVLVVLAGHFGGTLARGSGYLTYYLPEPIRTLVGLEGGARGGLIADVDSARVYDDLVQPILDRNCIDCHGSSKSEGDLRLHTREGIEEGGRDGPAYVAGLPAQSEMVRRITLPPYDEDAMPPDGGPPLDVGETEVIRWWIANGASFDQRVAEIEETPTAVSTYLARVSQPRTPRRSGIYALDVPEADTLLVAQLEETGVLIQRIDPVAPFLRVSATSVRDAFGDAEMEALRPIAEQIAVLDVGHSSVTSEGAAVLSEMPHLTHVHLEGTGIDDTALEHVRAHEYLEYLNLYATAVTDGGLAHVAELPALRSLYLWQTNVTDEGAGRLQDERPSVEVNLGGTLTIAPINPPTNAPSDTTEAGP